MTIRNLPTCASHSLNYPLLMAHLSQTSNRERLIRSFLIGALSGKSLFRWVCIIMRKRKLNQLCKEGKRSMVYSFIGVQSYGMYHQPRSYSSHPNPTFRLAMMQCCSVFCWFQTNCVLIPTTKITFPRFPSSKFHALTGKVQLGFQTM